jgi:sugar lactone lactonase YvrE
MNNQEGTRRNKPSMLNYLFYLFIFIFPLLFLPIYPYLRIDSNFYANYIKLPESPKFEGNLKENLLLQNAVYFAKGNVAGPETVLFVNNSMYTGLTNGQLVRVDDNGNAHKIAQIGDQNCDDLHSIHSKYECGRPLGLRYKSNFIYLADAYHGIYKVNLETNEKHVVISANDKRFNEPLKFIDDLDIDQDDNIYFTVSTRKRELHESVELHVETIPDGRVFSYNEKTNELSLLIDNMIFPNGIQLSPNNEFLIVAEHGMARLVKYYLKGPRKGQTEIMAHLPGFPDNIRLSDHNTLFVALVLVRNPKPYRTTMLDLLGEYPLVRTIIGRIIDLEKVILKLPKYGLLVEYDFDGNILKSFHDPTGKIIELVTCVTQHNNKLYIGSFIHDYIGVIDYN